MGCNAAPLTEGTRQVTIGSHVFFTAGGIEREELEIGGRKLKVYSAETKF